ncbi:MAG: hypothetical protein HOB92_05210 [Candidatus Cloacimonetes bacterium]|nr:hypothetical protein [Candidatus Cloacimonadota bacterium]
MAIGRIVIILSILIVGCHTRHEYYTYTPEVVSQPSEEEKIIDNWEHIVKQREFNEAKLFTMIPFDELIISNGLSDKNFLNLLYKRTQTDSILYMYIFHEGHNLLHINKEDESLFITADSLDYIYTACKTNRDDETFIYQTFAKYGFTIQLEKFYYVLELIDLNQILYAEKFDLKLQGVNNSITFHVPNKTKVLLRKFFKRIILVN